MGVRLRNGQRWYQHRSSLSICWQGKYVVGFFLEITRNTGGTVCVLRDFGIGITGGAASIILSHLRQMCPIVY